MGTPEFAVPVAKRLLKAGHDLVGVYTQPDKPAGRGKRTSPTPVKRFALERGLAVFQPRSLSGAETRAAMEALEPDASVVAAYGKLLPRPVLDIPQLGCLNIHPSLLPRHRGASPVAAAILSGDGVTGVTVMLLDEGLDTGPVLAQREARITRTETADSLTRRLFEMGGDLVVEVLRGLAEGTVPAREQVEEDATMSTRLDREAGRIDWSVPAERIALMVRAYHPWPGTFTTWNGRTIKILEASPVPGDRVTPGTVRVARGSIEVATGAGALIVTRLQIEGRRAVSASEFVAGHPGLAGSIVG